MFDLVTENEKTVVLLFFSSSLPRFLNYDDAWFAAVKRIIGVVPCSCFPVLFFFFLTTTPLGRVLSLQHSSLSLFALLFFNESDQ